MIETAFFQFDDPAHLASSVCSLSSPIDRRWAGVVALSPNQTLHLQSPARHDVFLLRGILIEFDTIHRIGTFITRHLATTLQAGSDGALCYVYRDIVQPVSASVTVAEHDQKWFTTRQGMKVALLNTISDQVMLVSWSAGTRIPFHRHRSGEDIFVLSGELSDERGHYRAGSWLRFHDDEGHAPYAEMATLILLRNGHLTA